MTQVPTPDDRIKSGKELAGVLSDLTDHEIVQVGRIVTSIQEKYSRRTNTAKNLEEMRDEILTRLADVSVLATVDPSPCFYGEPPVLEIQGKIATDPIHKYGMDHERKREEVIESKRRNEDFRGQKEPYNG